MDLDAANRQFKLRLEEFANADDFGFIHDFFQIQQYMNRETGMTVILITHHMDEAARADRVIAMSEGRIVADGTPQAVFAQEPLLRSVGLDVPQTEQLLLELKRRGVDIPTDALTPEACAQLLRQRIARS